MNNKGFAITGILYTILIVFLLILVSILAALSSRKNLLEKSVESIETEYVGEELSSDKVLEVINSKIASVTGKYEFSVGILKEDGSVDEDFVCYSYVKKGADLSDLKNITYTTKGCNDLKNLYNFTLIKIYSFEK